MQIIIPMSGFGERFRRAGYAVPKPLIPVDGRPMITHVIDLFPGAEGILFICNEQHLSDPSLQMAKIIVDHHPSARIVGIPSHSRGPIHAVLAARGEIDPDRPTIVNYCDFSCLWDFADFRRFVAETDCDGAIPAYRGFHPHSLGSTFYAYVQETGLWATAIQEKKPYTDDPSSEFASSGTYYFKSAQMMLDYFSETISRDINVAGEYYVSLAYIPMLEARRRIAVYELQHFLQWGTPEDLQEYESWSRLFAALTERRDRVHSDALMLMPMAGAGKRFSDQGYQIPKPLIPVSGRPMVVQAAADLPATPHTRFITRKDLLAVEAIEATLAAEIIGSDFVRLEGLTEGQAITCLMGLEGIPDETPLIIGACDNGLVYDGEELEKLLAAPRADVIAFGVSGHPPARRNPQHFGWISADDQGKITGVSVKVPLGNPQQDPIVTGTFIFKRVGDFRRTVAGLVAEDRRVNGEFYVDSCLNLAIEAGLSVHLLNVRHYIGWGTPDELRSFEYWQSCFHKMTRHCYRLDRDARVPRAAVAELEQRCLPFVPARPAEI